MHAHLVQRSNSVGSNHRLCVGPDDRTFEPAWVRSAATFTSAIKWHSYETACAMIRWPSIHGSLRGLAQYESRYGPGRGSEWTFWEGEGAIRHGSIVPTAVKMLTAFIRSSHQAGTMELPVTARP